MDFHLMKEIQNVKSQQEQDSPKLAFNVEGFTQKGMSAAFGS